MDERQLVELAQQRLERGHAQGAIDSLKQALSLNPESAHAHALLAHALLDQRRRHAAEVEARLALALEPESELGLYAAARVAFAARRFGQAEQHLVTLLEQDPLAPVYHRLLASLHMAQSRPEAARACLEKARQLDPEDPDTLATCSEFCLQDNDLTGAESFAEAALRVDAEHAHALVTMGWVRLRQGRVAEAREHAVLALSNGPGNVDAIRLIAAAKARQSYVLGLWWRYNAWITALGETRSVLVLLAAFIVYQVATTTTEVMGSVQGAQAIRIAWLCVVAYTAIGPLLFFRALKKEVSSVRLRPDF